MAVNRRVWDVAVWDCAVWDITDDGRDADVWDIAADK
jgi:hypothetical protein